MTHHSKILNGDFRNGLEGFGKDFVSCRHAAFGKSSVKAGRLFFKKKILLTIDISSYHNGIELNYY